MKDQFIGESIKPILESADTRRMAIGEPGLPDRFAWRDEEYSVDRVLEQWKETLPCSHGSGEKYVRKHWFRFRTTGGKVMTVYFERQARPGSNRTSRWWLYRVSGSAIEE